MKRLEIIVEGLSEREFVSQSLAPYLERMGAINASERDQLHTLGSAIKTDAVNNRRIRQSDRR